MFQQTSARLLMALLRGSFVREAGFTCRWPNL